MINKYNQYFQAKKQWYLVRVRQKQSWIIGYFFKYLMSVFPSETDQSALIKKLTKHYQWEKPSDDKFLSTLGRLPLL